MISPITWLWNIRHRKLIEETKAIIRLHQFLWYEVGSFKGFTCIQRVFLPRRISGRFNSNYLSNFKQGQKRVLFGLIFIYYSGIIYLYLQKSSNEGLNS